MTTQNDNRGEAAHGHEPKPVSIQIHVDGEHETAHRAVMTPTEIIQTFTSRDPATYYLVQLRGHERVSYQGTPDVPIHLENGMKFMTISLGPTPVSDGAR